MAKGSGNTRNTGVNCVAIGGGTGLSTALFGLKSKVGASIEDLTAIVAVSDDGGSSGRLREEFSMPPPGDIRNCMVALGEDSLLLSRLFQFRFAGDGSLAGHSFGNLFLAALSSITGDFAEAVSLSSEILASRGRVLPATDADVRIGATLKDGTVIRGETAVGHAGPQVERVFLEPLECEPLPEALTAIDRADVITIGPGSLYTSLLPPVLVNGMSEAIAGSRAKKIFICNLMTQPGETDGMSSRKHLEIFAEHAPEIVFDHVIVNNRPITCEQARKYGEEGAEQIGIHESLSPAIVERTKVFYTDLLETGEKVRHDPDRLANAILSVAAPEIRPSAMPKLTNGRHAD